MKRTLAAVLLIASATSVLAQEGGYPHERAPWEEIVTPPLHAFHPEPPRHLTLPNGIEIFLEEDHELPFITGYMRIRGGSRDEPADKLGLVSLYGQSWRTSGTSTTPGDKLDDQLALKAASIETGSGQASTYVSLNCFTQDFDSTFASALDLLRHPQFQQTKLDLARRSAMTGILRRNDEADGIAVREALQIAYGKDNPYGRTTQLATLSSIMLDDLNAWHKRTVVGSNIIVGMVGDFDAKALEAKLRKAFESIPRGEKLAAPKVAFSDAKPGIYFAAKDDVNQSNIYLVGLGTEESNPDYYALSVMNEIFSGGFGSRVVQDVRTRLGLAYEVGGSFGAAYDHPGLFAISAGTRSAQTVAATQAILKDVGELRTETPSPEELKRAKDDLLNSFIFRFDDTEKILAQQITLAVYGYPADFLERYRAGIEKVTAEDVSRVANKYVQPEKLSIVVVGNPAELDPPLSKLGPVTTLDISIPGAPKE
ncbi:M16 family metallopeptidase [Granulicella cerasi]|uniref:M16 family metallopeptidase n=1 Tax=Granulicella cerasi TaxID=741063 RepID=A0ABW1Z7S7_9BACT|nr:pitrilysin family protein [Granulicella cerasi]